jgi:hypothetical protein
MSTRAPNGYYTCQINSVHILKLYFLDTLTNFNIILSSTSRPHHITIIQYTETSTGPNMYFTQHIVINISRETCNEIIVVTHSGAQHRFFAMSRVAK